MFLFITVMAVCANSLTAAESKSDLRTELEAPLPSSLSQYYQPPVLLNLHSLKQQQEQLQQPLTLAQLLRLQNPQNQQLPQQQQPIIQPIHQTQINPFLYLGQLTSDTGEYSNNRQLPNQRSLTLPQEPQPKTKSYERNIQSQEKNSYVLYRPSADEKHDYVDLTPPSESQEEPNYYVMLLKPRKLKKYVETDVAEKKLKARKESEKLKHQIKRSESELTNNNDNDGNESDLLTESTDYTEQSEPTSRLDFQMHGHKGPKSYHFGYDYGSDNGLNRQFRVEERDSKGDVHGKYGYFDRKGKFRVVKYSSTAKDGFRVHS